MTPYKQLVKHDPFNGQYGDCARTAIACLLNMHPSEVEHFLEDGCADGEVFWRRVNGWLSARGAFNLLHVIRL
jgi:hypothetical protein